MQGTRTLRRWARTGRYGLALAVAVGAGLGMAQAPSFAAPADDLSASQPNTERVCAPAKVGEYTCFSLRRTDVAGAKGIQPNATPSGYGPGDLRSAYQLPADGGAGATVAIVDAYDDPNAEADLAVYRQQYGLPACTTADGCFSKIDQRGGTSLPQADSGWAGEISLDLDMVSAVAPNAHILLVEADSASFEDLGAAVNTAVAAGVKYVSNSYGTGYDATPGSGESQDELTYEQQYYNHPGVAITASSGDSSYGVSFPAASQYVTSVGGTSLTRDSSSRGWSESVWHNSYGGAGSGCSQYEPKPSFQSDTACDQRTVADVAAVADPATGVAVYNSYQAAGWAQYGGTSASAPIIAGVYADAGSPVAGSYPNSYPYAKARALNDVTTGTNGACSNYLCQAGAGYDGPTGLGTPNGLAAFRSGAQGTVSGTVTSAKSGAAVAGATIKVGDDQATSGADGSYSLAVPPGSYDAVAAAYGYQSKTTAVTVTATGTVTADFALAPLAAHTVSGTVTDGGGNDWPLYAKITVDGVPGGPVYTDPYTGKYSIRLPTGHDYTLHVAAQQTGYRAVTSAVRLGDADVHRDLSVQPDVSQCAAPGYAKKYDGSTQTFDATTAPDGWTVTDATGGGAWRFDDPGKRTNTTGGSGGFAVIDSAYAGSSKTQDTALVSPVLDMSGNDSPVITFDTYYRPYFTQAATVDVSIDGGSTWTTAWQKKTGTVSGRQQALLPTAANQSDVQVRFRFRGSYGWWWEVDDVFLGRAYCDPQHGGLVAGQVLDANTGDGVDSASVVDDDQPSQTASTVDAPGLGAGFYWMYYPQTGSHSISASRVNYHAATDTVSVTPNDVTRADLTLTAGRITVDKQSVKKTVAWGGSASGAVTVTNTGDQPATIRLGEQAGGFQPQAATTEAPKQVVKATVSPLRHTGKTGKFTAGAPAAAPAAGDAWTPIADVPTNVQDNAVGVYDGLVYSAFGYSGGADLDSMYAYDPVQGSWRKLASAADVREGLPAHGFIDGKFYAVGGWGAKGAPDTKLEIYDPKTDSWSTGATAPKAFAGAGSAVLNGKLYSVGGCNSATCGQTTVMVYDPAKNSWSQAADYPEGTSWASCGSIAGKLYCAGGLGSGPTTHSYGYDPTSDSWTRIADLPLPLFGSAYAAANGRLLVSGGASTSTVTNQGFAYNPQDDTWSALPNANQATYRGGSAAGLYRIGGNAGGPTPVSSAALLPGYGQADASDVSWLSMSVGRVTLAPGQSKKVRLAFDASVGQINQPGTYRGTVEVVSDTPYEDASVTVAMKVQPPTTWGRFSGTVSGPDGTPLAGVVVQIDSWAASYVVITDSAGHYQLWLDYRSSPVTVIYAKDGYRPQVRTVTIEQGKTVEVDVTLAKG
ncbi:hypothetical protein Athai_44330 [Actinocatenispora thailandica]|uniref:Peptidase S53 domain-containing protein n=1 Tax=Actinocatenispora thailandica TaxID=227318 RepID=A0A7R7DS75_9ACTN|nr:carboxypeptidase regulatory-like domain-containing protein [Actinocatenispora thailandica]BCJ36930.1 hypothetical protein Athai_44330 [Actinocatenispora thailandica]